MTVTLALLGGGEDDGVLVENLKQLKLDLDLVR